MYICESHKSIIPMVNKHTYEAPEAEVLNIAVERGFLSVEPVSASRDGYDEAIEI